jgi:hypothetical protein
MHPEKAENEARRLGGLVKKKKEQFWALSGF